MKLKNAQIAIDKFSLHWLVKVGGVLFDLHEKKVRMGNYFPEVYDWRENQFITWHPPEEDQ